MCALKAVSALLAALSFVDKFNTYENCMPAFSIAIPSEPSVARSQRMASDDGGMGWRGHPLGESGVALECRMT